ncbi:putative quinol monooxygenase [Salininema proteolyticum]|uniref:Quinol monooxygenase n=1 Tax=Salininema proteolyticum TaxID=1607685 RepID=A0ABV8TTW1_9ACTN
MTYAVIAHYKCRPEDAGLIRSTLAVMRESVREKEPGNVLYFVHEDAEQGEEARFTLYEQFTDEAAFQSHLDSEHYAEHIAGLVRPMLIERKVWFGHVL